MDSGIEKLHFDVTWFEKLQEHLNLCADTVLPSQFYSKKRIPELNLYVGVLKSSIEDVLKRGRKACDGLKNKSAKLVKLQMLQKEALDWFLTPNKEVQINFRDCCEILNLDLSSWQKEAKKGFPNIKPHFKLWVEELGN
jgi:hypothetical protein